MACGRTITNVGLRLSSYFWRCIRSAAAFALLTAIAVAPAAAAPPKAPVKATLAVTVSDGYARLVFTADEYIEATTKVAGHVLIITFKQPIDVSVDRVPELASDYVGAARRDPDGTAIRMALSQEVTVNPMDAGEKLFVDLLPSSWTGPPPGLPQDVVTELARRAREAERQLQRQRELTQAKYVAPIRVHVASLPTFTRYVFDVTGETAVAADRSKDRLVLNFDAPLTFDLADAQAALPNGVQAIDGEIDKDSSLVRFVFSTNLDLRTFRDESGYVVDVVKSDDAAARAGGAGAEIGKWRPAKSGSRGRGRQCRSGRPEAARSRWSHRRHVAPASRALYLIRRHLHWRKASSCRRRNLCRRPRRLCPQAPPVAQSAPIVPPAPRQPACTCRAISVPCAAAGGAGRRRANAATGRTSCARSGSASCRTASCSTGRSRSCIAARVCTAANNRAAASRAIDAATCATAPLRRHPRSPLPCHCRRGRR